MSGNGKTGDWAGFERMLSGIGESFKREVQKATNENGRILEKAIVGRIENQQGLKALSPLYLAQKIRKGLSEQILIATATLMQNIRYKRIAWNEGMVSVNRKEAKHGYDLGWIHEYGSRDGRVPARPFVEPGVKEVADKIVANYEAAIERTFE